MMEICCFDLEIELELELELIQYQMTQKPMLRCEVGARSLRTSFMREVDMERQARSIALVCGTWGLSLCCAPWAKFARVAVREKSSRVHVPAGSHFQLNAKDPSLHISWSARSWF